MILSFLSPLPFSCFCSCSLLLFMLCSLLVSVFLICFCLISEFFFISVESSLLSFDVSSHCLSSSMSSVLFMYFFFSFNYLNSSCLVDLSLFFFDHVPCCYCLVSLSFSHILLISLDSLIGLYRSALHPSQLLISVIASCASSSVEKHIIASFLVLFG